jgi:hypothetical protein
MPDPSTSPLKAYISSTCEQIQNALSNGAVIDGPITFELSTVVQRDTAGGLDIGVLNLGSEGSQSQIQKILFAVRFPSEVEKARDAANMAKSQREIAEATVYAKAFSKAIPVPNNKQG